MVYKFFFGFLFTAAAAVLCLNPTNCRASSLSDALLGGGSALYNLGGMLKDADNARALYERHRHGRDAARYEREWREREYRLEEARIERMAREAHVDRAKIRALRESGRGWDDIARRYKVNPRTIDYGHRGPGGYDRDHDHDLYKRYYKEHGRGHYKDTPYGPPGQEKKDRRGDSYR